MKPTLKIGLIADDFTGAMDSGAQFSCSKLSVQLRIIGKPSGDVAIINTASREISKSEAVTRNIDACRLLVDRQLFKKIDSTLRGHVGAEVEAILSASYYRKAIICPAAPLQGRTILDGVLFINGVPLKETSFNDDPIYPAKSSYVVELIKAPTARISLDLVRAPLEQLTAAITSANQPLLIADAETPEDLLSLSHAILATNSLPCGAFGLAKAFLEALNVDTNVSSPFQPEWPVLVLVGSANQMAREQVRILETLPDCLVLKLGATPPPEIFEQIFDQKPFNKRILVLSANQDRTICSPEWIRFGKTVSEIGRNLLESFQPQTIGVIGGETATYFCELVMAESIQILGETMPGIPYGRIQGGRLDQHLLITKAGGFGEPGTLKNIFISKE